MGHRDADSACRTASVSMKQDNYHRKQSGVFGLGFRLCAKGSYRNLWTLRAS
jgi:hypothetical protein